MVLDVKIGSVVMTGTRRPPIVACCPVILIVLPVEPCKYAWLPLRNTIFSVVTNDAVFVFNRIAFKFDTLSIIKSDPTCPILEVKVPP